MQLTERQKHHLERMQAHEATQNMLVKILECLLSEHNRQKNLAERKPFYETVGISAIHPYVIDYRNRKHIYIWLPSTSQTLSFKDYGSGTVQAMVWVNLGLPAGINMLAPNVLATAPTTIMILHTDEVIP